MKTNRIPKRNRALTQAAMKALEAAEACGPELDLKYNSSGLIAADVYDLVGNPLTPEIPGKQAQLNARKEELAAARASAKVAKKAAQEFCRKAISVLRSVLGTSYNRDWEAAGFLTRSLAVPREPVPMLIQFRQYLTRHPQHENAPLDVTAAKAKAVLATQQAAELAARSAEARRVAAKAARDAAQKKLQKRLSKLREELGQVLGDEDGTWLKFGFRRPADGRKPAPVPSVEVTPLAPGVVKVAWPPTPRTEAFRVTWKIASDAASTVGSKSVNDRQCTLTDLPGGTPITIGVSARNSAGETAPTEVTVLLP